MLQPKKCHKCGHEENRHAKKGNTWYAYCTKCQAQVREIPKKDAGFLDKDEIIIPFGVYKGRVISNLDKPKELEFLMHITRTPQRPDFMRAVEAHLETVYSPVKELEDGI